MATLGDIEKILQNIKNSKLKAVQALHVAAYGEEGRPRLTRRNLKKFLGFKLDRESSEYRAKVGEITNNLNSSDLTAICHILNLDYAGQREDILDRVCSFLNDLSVSDDIIDEQEDLETEDEAVEDRRYTDESENEDRTDEEDSPRLQSSARAKARRNNSFALTFRDMEDSIRPFDGKDDYPIEKWIQDFEEISEITGWNDLQKLIFAKKSLTGLAKLFVQSEKGIKSWNTLKKKLTEEFEVKISSAQVHKQLMSRKKRYSETVQEYVLVMREIGSRAMLEAEVIIQYIIDGIQDDTSNKIVLYGARSFAELKDKVKLYEQIRTKKYTHSSEKSGLTRRKNEEKEVKKEEHHDRKGKPTNCFNCGLRGHKSSGCPDRTKGIKCYNCDDFGHVSAKCPKRKTITNEHHTSANVCTMEAVPKNSVKVQIDNVQLTALLDTGSDITAIRSDVYNDYFRHITLTRNEITIQGIGPSRVKTEGFFQKTVRINDEDISLTFHVIPTCASKFKAIVGNDLLKSADISIGEGGIIIYKKSPENFLMEIKIADEVEQEEIQVNHIPNLDCRSKVRNMMENYSPKQIKDVDITMKLILKDEEPVYQHPRRLSPNEKAVVEEQIQEWLEEGIIRPSYSEFASPIVLVKKKDGSTRICCDYRKINRKIIRDRFPLPLIEDVLDRLQGAKYFSTIDLWFLPCSSRRG
ncbi:uncharacterized protein [Euwallacea similis]|uniref:uncharacterized protein n=1 Tax=Euwallacea similis TaxID=1736056 RepID=UPI00344C7D26